MRVGQANFKFPAHLVVVVVGVVAGLQKNNLKKKPLQDLKVFFKILKFIKSTGIPGRNGGCGTS